MGHHFTAFKYAAAIFAIVMFLWWFQGGHIIAWLKPRPSPAEVMVVGTANAARDGLANIFSAFVNLFQ
jgi:hypothetical protein